jgi:hypothetical protein
MADDEPTRDELLEVKNNFVSSSFLLKYFLTDD